MNVIVDFCLIPLDAGLSLSKYIAACQDVVQKAGLNSQLHAYGTNIEGDWETVMSAIKECHQVVHSMGVSRINTTIKLGTRTDKAQTMEDKVSSVKKLLK